MTTTTKSVYYGTTLQATTCGECGVPFGLTAEFIAGRQSGGATFYCPNGHARCYRETDLDRARKELRRVTDNREWWAKQAQERREQADHERNRANGYKGALTKTKKRIAAGVCPCCRRQFQNVERHMKGQHPDYGAGAPDV